MKKKTKIKKHHYRKYKTYKPYKPYKPYKRTKSLRGGSNASVAWIGVANPEQPTGFGWLHQSFFKPCR